MLDWEDAANTLTYDVYLQKEDHLPNQYAKGLTDSSFLLTDLSIGGTWSWWVVAYNAANGTVSEQREALQSNENLLISISFPSTIHSAH